jgi:hypothetical protein
MTNRVHHIPYPNSPTSWPRDSAFILLGNGHGTFLGPTLTCIGAATLLLVDLNGDGLPDLITGYDILLGNGDGSFQSPRPYFTPKKSVTPMPFVAATSMAMTIWIWRWAAGIFMRRTIAS